MASPGRDHLPTAIVIGCGGIAIACARRLGQTHRLLVVDRDEVVARDVAAMLGGEGHVAESAACDITDPDALRALAAIASALAPVQTLVHVVGLAPSAGDPRAILRVNATGAALTAEALFQLLSAGGSAVFISSLGGHMVPAAPAIIAALDDPLAPVFLRAVEDAAGDALTPANAYAWSKIALMRMCQRLAPRWGGGGVRINSVSPGLIDSPMGRREFASEPRKYALLEKTPLSRQGSMIEIADAVEFLCSSRASFISGTDLLVDGGLAAALRQPG